MDQTSSSIRGIIAAVLTTLILAIVSCTRTSDQAGGGDEQQPGTVASPGPNHGQ